MRITQTWEADDRAFDRFIDGKKISTLGRKQRQLINEGIDQADREDHALRRCILSGASNFLKRMCCMLPIALSMKGVDSYMVNNTNINNTFDYGEDHDIVVGSS